MHNCKRNGKIAWLRPAITIRNTVKISVLSMLITHSVHLIVLDKRAASASMLRIVASMADSSKCRRCIYLILIQPKFRRMFRPSGMIFAEAVLQMHVDLNYSASQSIFIVTLLCDFSISSPFKCCVYVVITDLIILFDIEQTKHAIYIQIANEYSQWKIDEPTAVISFQFSV